MKLARKFQKRDLINIIVLVVLLGLFAWIGWLYAAAFGAVEGGDMLDRVAHLRDFILNFGGMGVGIMILLHAVQVVVSFIPAALVQFAGSVVYGMWGGMFIGIFGVLVGTAASFYISRLFGRSVVTLFVSEKTMEKAEARLSSNTSALALLVLFIIPFPKDFIAYFMGLTKMKAGKFLTISTLGRLPGMLVATYLGAHVLDRNLPLLIGVTVVSTLLLVLSYVFHQPLLRWLSKKEK